MVHGGHNTVHGCYGRRRSFPDQNDTRPALWPTVHPRFAGDGLGRAGHACGLTEDEILDDYPYLEKADFPAVYAYASQVGRERVSR